MIKKLWSKEIETEWHPVEDFFEKSVDDIAHGLKNASNDLAQAMERLNFYINRAGSNLSVETKAKLEKAKEKLEKLYNCCHE